MYSTKAHSPTYRCICNGKYNCLRLNGVKISECSLCNYQMTKRRLDMCVCA